MLQRMGMQVNRDHIYTCAMTTANFLKQQGKNVTAYVLGEGGLLNALDRSDIAVVDKDPDYVVVGEGRSYTFEMLEQATNLIINGAKLIATNMEPNCPTDNGGTRPSCGAIVRLLEEATGKKAFDLGKPSPLMMRDARKLIGLEAARTFMIGDTMETDILGGLQLGYQCILVLSGGMQREHVDKYAYAPKAIVNSIADLSIETLSDLIQS